MIAPLLFALSLLADYDVPLPYGYAVFEAAIEADVSPFDLGALLTAENKSRRFLAGTVGRYGATAGTPRAERGLFQLSPYWSKRCGITRRELFDPYKNIRCAAVVVRHMQKRAGVRRAWVWGDRFEALSRDPDALEDLISITPKTRPDWRTHYRCHPKHRTSPGCSRSVRRVVRMQRRLHRAWNARGELRFWLIVAAKTGPALVRSLGVGWLAFSEQDDHD